MKAAESYRGVAYPNGETLQEQQDVAIIRFDNGKSGKYEFSKEQYFSSIRRKRIVISGVGLGLFFCFRQFYK